MNIFVLDYNPQVAAEYHCDKHVVKMILETAQILCAVHHKNGDTNVPYKLTHANHPCTIWAGKSKQNYLWLTELAEHLNNEYMFRFNQEVNHKSYDVIANLQDINLPDIGLTKFAEAMPDYCKVTDCTVMNYREYYRKEKAHILRYTNAQTPYWLGVHTKSVKLDLRNANLSGIDLSGIDLSGANLSGLEKILES